MHIHTKTFVYECLEMLASIECTNSELSIEEFLAQLNSDGFDAKIASGGELSRIMLAIKTVLAEVDHIATIVFDEIDANIGGETAVVVAGELNQLGKRKQILCISHLAQVAARADRHFVVEKKTTSETAVSTIHVLDRKGRIAEIARMLGGGPAAEKHAEALLA